MLYCVGNASGRPLGVFSLYLAQPCDVPLASGKAFATAISQKRNVSGLTGSRFRLLSNDSAFVFLFEAPAVLRVVKARTKQYYLRYTNKRWVLAQVDLSPTVSS